MTAAQVETVLAIDVGTSSLKAVLFTRDGSAAGQIAMDYPTHAAEAGTREQDTHDWWSALTVAVRALAPALDLRAIVLTGSMQNCIAIGPDARPIGRAILYSDARVSGLDRVACEARLPVDFRRRIGNMPDGAMPIFRLMTGDPRLARGRGVRYLFGAKDVLIARLTGRAVIDPTTATTTGLLGVAAGDWDLDLVRAAGLDVEQLPEVLPADAVIGPLGDAAAVELGLPPGLPVINGAGDAGAATWGAGGSAVGSAHVYLGTTGWVAAITPRVAGSLPGETYMLMSPIGDAMIAIAPLLQAGSALDWARRFAIGPEASDAEAIDRSPPSALFLPYLAGERFPFQDRDVRAAFLGLDERTGPDELHYAALEGLCHAIRDNLEALASPPTEMPLIGGVAENPMLRQLLADTLDLPVLVPPQSRLATAYGAYLLAASALGWDRFDTTAHTRTAPRPERRNRAERRFLAYRGAQRTARAVAADLLVQPDDIAASSTMEEQP